MADMYAVPGETLTGIANAIHSKTGSDEQMPVSAMAAAIEGISGGSGAFEGIPTITDPSLSIAYMMSCIKNGNVKTGTKTWETAFPNQETLALETGLSKINGIMLNLVNSDMKDAYESSLQRNRFILIVENSGGTISAISVPTTSHGFIGINIVLGQAQGAVLQSLPLNGSVRFDGGNMYCAGRYNKNGNYQMVIPNVEYEWIAW